MKDKNPIIVYFDGEARELWTDDRLTVTYAGRLAVRAVADGKGGWRAAAPESDGSGNVKSDYNTASRARELAALINSGNVAPLTAAYFSTAASAAAALLRCGELPLNLPKFLALDISGGFDAVILLELLRLLLDERHLSWDDAAAIVAGCFTFRTEKSARTPLTALRALSPRCARLAETVNDKFCETIWSAYPGDWRHISACAVITEGEVDFGMLSAALCGRIICPEMQRAGEFRALYVAAPDKFEGAL
jgi:starch phosphorylase